MTEYMVSPFTGEQISIKRLNMDVQYRVNRRNYQWKFLKCGHIWGGNRKIWKQGRTPKHCPQCNGQQCVKKVKKRMAVAKRRIGK